MYNVKLKRGSLQVQMITAYLNLRRREERTRLSCLKIRSPLKESCTVCTGYAVSNMGVAYNSSGTRSREIRWINVHPWIELWSDRNLKTGRFDYLSVSWNYNTLFAALVQFFFFWPKSSCSSLGENRMNTRNDYDPPNKSWPWVSSERLKITRKYKYLKQTFRLLEEVVRETKAQSVKSFLRVR